MEGRGGQCAKLAEANLPRPTSAAWVSRVLSTVHVLDRARGRCDRWRDALALEQQIPIAKAPNDADVAVESRFVLESKRNYRQTNASDTQTGCRRLVRAGLRENCSEPSDGLA